jgi:hypothetical protein
VNCASRLLPFKGTGESHDAPSLTQEQELLTAFSILLPCHAVQSSTFLININITQVERRVSAFSPTKCNAKPVILKADHLRPLSPEAEFVSFRLSLPRLALRSFQLRTLYLNQIRNSLYLNLLILVPVCSCSFRAARSLMRDYGRQLLATKTDLQRHWRDRLERSAFRHHCRNLDLDESISLPVPSCAASVQSTSA